MQSNFKTRLIHVYNIHSSDIQFSFFDYKTDSDQFSLPTMVESQASPAELAAIAKFHPVVQMYLSGETETAISYFEIHPRIKEEFGRSKFELSKTKFLEYSQSDDSENGFFNILDI